MSSIEMKDMAAALEPETGGSGQPAATAAVSTPASGSGSKDAVASPATTTTSRYLDQEEQNAAERKVLQGKKAEIERAGEAALVALQTYRTMVAREFGKTSLAVPGFFATMERCFLRFPRCLDAHWELHASAMMKDSAQHRADLRSLVTVTTLKRKRDEGEEEVLKELEAESARLGPFAEESNEEQNVGCYGATKAMVGQLMNTITGAKKSAE